MSVNTGEWDLNIYSLCYVIILGAVNSWIEGTIQIVHSIGKTGSFVDNAICQ
jgi:hypothetical protein